MVIPCSSLLLFFSCLTLAEEDSVNAVVGVVSFVVASRCGEGGESVSVDDNSCCLLSKGVSPSVGVAAPSTTTTTASCSCCC
ncbi:hypothetical protein D3C80_2013730 [compost metagenome]